jgi:hypothetical protein
MPEAETGNQRIAARVFSKRLTSRLKGKHEGFCSLPRIFAYPPRYLIKVGKGGVREDNPHAALLPAFF